MTDQQRIVALGIDKVNVLLGVKRAELLEAMTAAGVSTPIDPTVAATWVSEPRLAPPWVRVALRQAEARKASKKQREVLLPASAGRDLGNDETARARATLLARPIAGASRSVPMSELRTTKPKPAAAKASSAAVRRPPSPPSYVVCRACGQRTVVAKKNLLGRHETAGKTWCAAGRTPVTPQDVPVAAPAVSPKRARDLAKVPWASREALAAKFRGTYPDDDSPPLVDDVALPGSSVPTVRGGLPSLGKRR